MLHSHIPRDEHNLGKTGQISPPFKVFCSVQKEEGERDAEKRERAHTHTHVIHLHLYSNKRVESIVISSKKKKLMKYQGNITQGTNKPLHYTPNYNTSYLHSSTCGCACVHMCTDMCVCVRVSISKERPKSLSPCLSLSLYLSLTHTHTHIYTQTQTHTQTHRHTYTHNQYNINKNEMESLVNGVALKKAGLRNKKRSI